MTHTKSEESASGLSSLLALLMVLLAISSFTVSWAYSLAQAGGALVVSSLEVRRKWLGSLLYIGGSVVAVVGATYLDGSVVGGAALGLVLLLLYKLKVY